MTNWITDENGNQTFTCEGWMVRIWASSLGWPRRISVTAPEERGSTHEVEVDDDGLWVCGRTPGGWGDTSSAFTIPWPVIVAIIEARVLI